ncbi:hypothetical protein [Acetobacter indonesiensis]|uniref:hypothetical protein n=1 Tax=Acetobacter indonesiensis TaxID=104101 RepID=UPI0039EC9662
MSDKPIGVFVRLPLSDEQKQAMYDYVSGDISMEAAILAIGTPVTGGELEVVGYAPGEDLPLYGDEGIDDTCFTEISLHRQADNDVPLIHQSDALAKLAEKDAEIVELREAEAHARADAEAAKARVERFRKIVDVFSAKISECASEGHDLSGADCVDLLNDAGVIEWGVFDPEVHDYATFDGCEAGDPIWTLKGPEA